MSRIPLLTLLGGMVLEGRLEVSFELSKNWLPNWVGFISKIVGDFVDAGRLGAYCAPSVEWSASRLESTGELQTSGNELRFYLTTTAIDARCFQYLRHMSARHVFDGANLRRITVTELRLPPFSRQNLPLIGFHNEDTQYPVYSDRVNFGIGRIDGPTGKFRRILIEMASDLTCSQFDEVRVAAEAWGMLVQGGAFVPPLGSPESVTCVVGAITQFDVCTIEVEVPVLIGSESCWEPLFSMLAALNEKGARESSLRIVMVSV